MTAKRGKRTSDENLPIRLERHRINRAIGAWKSGIQRGEIHRQLSQCTGCAAEGVAGHDLIRADVVGLKIGESERDGCSL